MEEAFYVVVTTMLTIYACEQKQVSSPVTLYSIAPSFFNPHSYDSLEVIQLGWILAFASCWYFHLGPLTV